MATVASARGRLRAEYLKNGCRECKRRKIKCDEFLNPPLEAYRKLNHQNRVLCWQCTRLKKVCEYPVKGERVDRVSRKVLRKREEEAMVKARLEALQLMSPLGQPGQIPGHPSTHLPGQLPGQLPGLLPGHPSGPGAGPPTGQLPGYPSGNPPPAGPPPYMVYRPDDTHPPQPPQSLQPQPLPPQQSRPGSPKLKFQPVLNYDAQQYTPADLSLLASDLNNLVNEMIFEGGAEPRDTGARPRSPQTFEPSPETLDPKPPASYDWIPRNVGLGIFDVSQEERVYLQEFYLGFASVILPFNAYDGSQHAYFNPMRDILFNCAYHQSFLLAAILAQGARSLFLKTAQHADELNYYKYLSECLTCLRPALEDSAAKPDSSLVPDIETVLLTVLLLASSNAAHSRQNWRPHLKGAKDMLIKHTATSKGFHHSKILLFCKYWFVSFEILAGLGLKLGGTVDSEAELDILLDFSDPLERQVLKTLGLVAANDFYLIGGYHVDLIPHLKRLMKLLKKARGAGAHSEATLAECVRLLSEFDRQCKVEFVNNKAVLTNADFPHGIVPPGLLLDSITVQQNHLIISWMDILHQLYCIAAMITILSGFMKLPYNSPLIQTLTRHLTSFMLFLAQLPENPRLIKCSVMMIQWPMLVAGENLTTQEDQFLVTRFFELARHAGAGSAGHSIARLQRMWANRASGNDSFEDDNLDVVTY